VVASIFHCGSDETMGAAYKHLNRWLDQSAFSLRGAKREIYWLEADGHTANEGLTEIQYPVVALSADESGRAGDRTFKPH
jgi:effector-binding domain-containing protein